MGLLVLSSQRKESAVQEIEAGKYFSNVSLRELRAKENEATNRHRRAVECDFCGKSESFLALMPCQGPRSHG